MDRTKSIGGSDVTRLFSNQEDAWEKLWEEKTGRRQPDDLSDIFHVQLGVAVLVPALLQLRFYCLQGAVGPRRQGAL